MFGDVNKEATGSLHMDFGERMCLFFKNLLTEDSDVVGYCKERAEAGDYNAMLWLARMYRDGKGVRKNAPKALEWYKKAKDHNVYAKFESLAMLSNRERKFENIPEGLEIDKRKKERLFVYKFNGKSMGLLVHLFPFTHYNVVGFSYEDKGQVGYNEGCEDYDKILVADVDNSWAIKGELISQGMAFEKVITVRRFTDKDKFDGDAIVCNFSGKVPSRKIWVVVPNRANGLLWYYVGFKPFRGENKSECDYVVDMQNHFSMMMDDNNVGCYNPWDYYFQPTSSLTLEEAYDREGVVISSWMPKLSNRVPSDLSLTLSDILNKKVDAEFKNFSSWDRTIGLIARGTDFVSLQPFNHRINLDEYELVEIVEERMNSLGFTHIYLSTEDQEVYDFFKNRFGDKMFAIEQMRFKKTSILNATLFDDNITEPFGKLIQGERYLIATHLATKCKLALVCGGSGSAYVYRNSSGIIERHVKGNWGQFGNAPLIVCSHNKNHISVNDMNYKEGFAHNVDSRGFVHFGGDQDAAFRGVGLFLDAKKKYICSFYTKEPESVSISLELCSCNGETRTIELRHGDTFISPLYVRSGNIIIKKGTGHNSEIGIQIEEGTTQTDYEASRYSWTQICLKDTGGDEYAPEGIDYIDFNQGIFSIQGREHILDCEEFYRYHRIVCFKGGFLTYRKGEYHEIKGIETKITLGETINSQKITGKPKQLRRFSHTVEMADNLIKGSEGNLERATCIYYYHAMNGNATAMGRLGRMYRDGKGVERDLDEAIKWMRKAADKNVGWAKNELFDILWKIDTPEAHEEMISVATEFAEKGDGNAMGRLGRMYRDGKGVERDLDEAIKWMRKAADKNVGWAKNELFDILWKIDTPEAHEEMISVATEFAEKGDGNAMGRLGRMYRDGKGVERDLDEAIKWMRKAADKNVGWAKNELFDILWKIDTPEAHEEMISVATEFAEKGDGNAMGRLGRAYRHGKGIEKDNGLAASYLLMAASSGAPWFICDYVIVKWEDNSSSSDSEAFAALTRYGNIDDVPTMIWFGKAYFYGRGTERNIAKATEFFRKAYNKGSLWAGFLLFDVLWTVKNDEGAINESIEIAKNLISKGSAEGMIRLARAYREGIGVCKNLDCAIELFNNAINKGNKSAVKELKETVAENNLIQSDNLIKSINECDVDSIISGDYDLNLLNKSMLMLDETGYDLSEFMHGLIDRIRKGNVEKERIRPLVDCINKILSKKDDDYTKQFFVSIPKTTGRLREIQMLGNDMLRIFDEVCKKYDVEYSICSGTLLGAIRHNGWIPWDDDTDLFMYMEDIEKLKASLGEDDPIKIQDVNIRADSKRFKPARYYWVKYRGIKSSMYMDIFILYHIPDEMNIESIYSQYLEKVYSDTEQFENKNSPQALQTVNSDYVTYFEQLMSRDEKSKRTGIITMGGKIWVFDTSDFKPFIEYEFDGYILKGMHNPYNYLSTNYGKIYSVPHDLGTHEHPLFDSVDANQIRSYTEQYLKN